MLGRWNKLLRLVYLDVIRLISVYWTFLIQVSHRLTLVVIG